MLVFYQPVCRLQGKKKTIKFGAFYDSTLLACCSLYVSNLSIITPLSIVFDPLLLQIQPPLPPDAPQKSRTLLHTPADAARPPLALHPIATAPALPPRRLALGLLARGGFKAREGVGGGACTA